MLTCISDGRMPFLVTPTDAMGNVFLCAPLSLTQPRQASSSSSKQHEERERGEDSVIVNTTQKQILSKKRCFGT